MVCFPCLSTVCLPTLCCYHPIPYLMQATLLQASAGVVLLLKPPLPMMYLSFDRSFGKLWKTLGVSYRQMAFAKPLHPGLTFFVKAFQRREHWAIKWVSRVVRFRSSATISCRTPHTIKSLPLCVFDTCSWGPVKLMTVKYDT